MASTPSRRPSRLFRLLTSLLVFLIPSAPASADSPFLTDDGAPNALFWATGAATMAADQPLYDAAQRLDSPATHKAAVFFNHVGDGRVQAGVFGLLLLAGNGTDRRIARRGLHGAVAGGLLVALLKATTRRARPYAGRGPDFGARPARRAPADARPSGEIGAPLEELSVAQQLAGKQDSVRSFPSGHSAAAFSLATVWANERPRDRGLAYSLAVLAGLSRIGLKQHWPSDVFWGAAIGTAAGNAANRGVPFGLMFRVR